jgi:hypothetical protein
MPAVAQGRPVHQVADTVAERLFAAAKRGSIKRIDIDVIRGACEIAAHYESMDSVEFRELEDKALRKIIGKVG